MPVIDCDPDRARERLESEGVEISPGNTEHELWRAERGGATAVAYSDSVVVQGTDPVQLSALLEDSGGRAYVYFDGASRGNPGPAAVGWVIVTDDGIVAEGSERIDRATNNQAEYEALIRALVAAEAYGFDELVIKGDSQLIVRQVRGEWDTNDPELREYRVRVRELLDRFEAWSLSHVPREVNERADRLANEAFEG